MGARIGYLLNTYPQPSVTFIRREIAALERRGHVIHRFAMRSDESGLKDAADLAELRRTEFVLAAGAPRLAGALMRSMLTRPRRTWAALLLALRMGARHPAGRLRHLVYLVEAAHVARRASQLGLTHLHAHFGTNPATVAALVARLGGPCYSFTVHGPEEFDAPEALSLPDKIAGARFVAAISQHGRSQLFRWARLADWDKIRVIRCGIEPASFADIPPPRPDGPVHLVNIGRFAGQKGQILLPAALAHAARLGADVRLTLVGDGPLRPQIDAAIDAAGMAGRVVLTGWLDDGGVRAALKSADALILPSFAEGLPVVATEAMAAGRPVISTWVAGIPELVRDGEEGLLVPAGDVEALGSAIHDFCALSDADRLAMGARARARVAMAHDIDCISAELEAAFVQSSGVEKPRGIMSHAGHGSS